MVHSDLNLYQTVLKNSGVKYILGTGKVRPSETIRPPVSIAPPSRKTTPSEPVKAQKKELIPPELIKLCRPAYSVWSYYKFPMDLNMGFTNPRRELISNIINSLKWNRQTYTFWPLSRIKDEKLNPDKELFFLGVKRIRPAYIFLFGVDAFKTIIAGSEYTYGSHEHKGQKIIVLPDLDSLMPDNRILKNMVWNMLMKYSPH